MCIIISSPRVLWDRATHKAAIPTVNSFLPENYTPITSPDFGGERKEREKDRGGDMKSTPLQLNLEVDDSEMK